MHLSNTMLSPTFSKLTNRHEKVSIDSLRDVYNPTDNTINLTKLSVALKLETPYKESN